MLFATLVPSGALAETRANIAPIHYTVTLENPTEHLLRVAIAIPPGPATRQLQMPVWNATYQIRDFSEYVRWVHARGQDGSPLEVRKLNKSLWQVTGMEQGGVIEYQLVADQPGPFGAQLNQEHAFFNLAQILIYPTDGRNAPITLHFAGIPEGWHVACALKGEPGELLASDYDALVDAPVELGTFQETSFSEDGAHYRIVVDAASDAYDLPGIKETLRKIVHAETDWMQDRPFQDYLFIFHFPSERGDGGMEHAYSTAIELSSQSLKSDPQQLAAMAAHEFFHLWNVKRIRPRSLAPLDRGQVNSAQVDYTKENYTRSLWFSEGVTSTVEQYALLEAGLIDEKDFLRNLSDEITALQSRPAHATQSAEESSLDAWLEKYPTYRQPTRSISYYNKGFLLGILLDLEMRKRSNDEASLKDLFHYLNQTYAKKDRPFDDSDGIRNAAESLSGADLREFFQKFVAGTDEIPYQDFLGWVGLRVAVREKLVPESGFRVEHNFDALPIVVYVAPASDAARAGLNVGDRLISMNNSSASRDLEPRMNALGIGAVTKFRIRNFAGVERDLSWKLGEKKTLDYEVTDTEQVTPEQLRHRKAWLGARQATPRPAAPGNPQ